MNNKHITVTSLFGVLLLLSVQVQAKSWTFEDHDSSEMRTVEEEALSRIATYKIKRSIHAIERRSDRIRKDNEALGKRENNIVKLDSALSSNSYSISGKNANASSSRIKNQVSRIGNQENKLGQNSARNTKHQSTILTDKKALELSEQGIEAKATEFGFDVNLQSDILFDFDKATLKPEAIRALNAFVGVIKGASIEKLIVDGHTDSKGSDAYNLDLSKRRAMAVGRWLQVHSGLNAVFTRSFGESMPVAPNTYPDGRDNPQGRAKNRRVNIEIHEKK